MPGGTGFVFHEQYLKHSLGKGHVESPERLRAILQRMKATGLDRLVKSIRPRYGTDLFAGPDLRASGDPLPYIKAVHPESHIRRVAEQAHDESICRLAVAGALAAVDAVCRGQVMNAFCALRPPGHHAAEGGENGYCFYNNIAIAARYAQKKHHLNRILIVDWDYHRGNGTEWAFYEDPSVLFFSTHERKAVPGTLSGTGDVKPTSGRKLSGTLSGTGDVKPTSGHKLPGTLSGTGGAGRKLPGTLSGTGGAGRKLPGTGFAERKGRGNGLGYNINVPLPPGANDQAILDAFESRMAPAAERFEPDLVLISAGFDSREGDLLGDFAVTDDGFAELTRRMMAVAETHASSRLVSVLEGGHNIEGLALAVESHIRTLLGE